MSKLFYDHLLTLDEVESEIKRNASSKEEQEEYWRLVDDVIGSTVIEKILDKLPRENHDEFLAMLYKSPHDEELIFGYLRGKAGKNIEEVLKQELKDMKSDILKEIKLSDETSTEMKLSKK